MQLRILTLNCWGLPFFSRDRRERVEAIGNALISLNIDLAAFQEVSNQDDRDLLHSLASKAGLAYSHHAPSIFPGSLYYLSRYPIIDTGFWYYRLNGRPHDFIRPDYYARKGLALARVELPIGNLDFYNTHLIAPYLEIGDDVYAHHRVAQAVEAARIIRERSQTVPALLAGDLNATPQSMSYLTLRRLADLRDSFSDANPDDPGITVTTDIPYIPVHVPERIDYILLRDGTDLKWFVQSSKVVLDTVPSEYLGSILAYSDHYGVLTTAELTNHQQPDRRLERVIQLRHIRDVLKSAQGSLESERFNKGGWSLVAGIVALGTIILRIKSPLNRREFLTKIMQLTIALFSVVVGATVYSIFQNIDEAGSFREILALLDELERSAMDEENDPGSLLNEDELIVR